MTGLKYQIILVRIFIVLATRSKTYKRIPRNSGGISDTQRWLIINGGYHHHSTCCLFLVASIGSVKRKDVVHRNANVCFTFRGWIYYDDKNDWNVVPWLNQELFKNDSRWLQLRRFIYICKTTLTLKHPHTSFASACFFLIILY